MFSPQGLQQNLSLEINPIDHAEPCFTHYNIVGDRLCDESLLELPTLSSRLWFPHIHPLPYRSQRLLRFRHVSVLHFKALYFLGIKCPSHLVLDLYQRAFWIHWTPRGWFWVLKVVSNAEPSFSHDNIVGTHFVWWVYEIKRDNGRSQALVHLVIERSILFTGQRMSGLPSRAKYKHFRTICVHAF